MTQSQIKHRIVGEILIASQDGNATPTEESFEGLISSLHQPDVRGLLFFSKGSPSLNREQRKMLIETVKGRKIKISGVSDSKVVHGVGVALSWVYKDVKAFAYNDFDGALSFLGCEVQKDLIWSVYEKM